MTNKIMVIAAHPDDEILGVGGTIRRLVLEGCEVTSVVMALGRKEEEERIRSCLKLANERLGVKETLHLQLPNLELEKLPLHVVAKKIEALLHAYKPDVIYTHHYGDLNRDHQIVFQAVMTAARPIAGKPSPDIICFETVSSTEWAPPLPAKAFLPNLYVDISSTIQDKIEALRHYDVEMRPFPHPRSYEGIEYLSSFRGMTVGVPYAEAFELIRKVVGP